MTEHIQNAELKAVVSVTEMARMLGLSRSRLYQLVKEGVLPKSAYDERSGRPVYTEEQQKICLEVRRRNLGVNGQPVLFYSRRIANAAPVPRTQSRRRKPAPEAGPYAELVDALRSLGLVTTVAQAHSSVAALYPDGHEGVEEGVLIRSVFRHLRQSNRQNTADNVGR
jgi:hypothetical protein